SSGCIEPSLWGEPRTNPPIMTGFPPRNVDSRAVYPRGRGLPRVRDRLGEYGPVAQLDRPAAVFEFENGHGVPAAMQQRAGNIQGLLGPDAPIPAEQEIVHPDEPLGVPGQANMGIGRVVDRYVSRVNPSARGRPGGGSADGQRLREDPVECGRDHGPAED